MKTTNSPACTSPPLARLPEQEHRLCPPTMPQALDAGGGSHFSFAAPVAGESQGPDGEGYGTWIQKVRGGYGYFSRANVDVVKQGARRKGGAAAGYRRGPSVEGGEPKRVAGPAVEVLPGEKARPLRLLPAVNPSSQWQAMARYRREMMELVRGVPEAAYELSLRDLVEVPRTEAPQEEAGKEKGGGPADQVVIAAGRDKKEEKEIKKARSGKKLVLRSASTGGGVFLLKLFFPPSLGWRRRSSSSGKGAKVSPKPMMAEGGEKRRPEKQVDAERLERCGEMSTRDETKNSGRRKAIGCYPFSIKQRPQNAI